VATSPCGNHLAREGRLARASALLLMQEQICHSFSAESSAAEAAQVLLGRLAAA